MPRLRSPSTGNPADLSTNRIKIIRRAFGHPDEPLPEPLQKDGPGLSMAALTSWLEGSTGWPNWAEKLKLASVLADAANEHDGFAIRILEDPGVRSPRDLALQYGFRRAKALAVETGAPAQHPAVKESLARAGVAGTGDGHGQGETGRAFALGFRRSLFAAEPTAVLQQMVASDDKAEELPIHADARVRVEAAKVLDRHPAFNMRTKSVLALLHDDRATLQDLDVGTQAAVAGSLKLLQRTQALAPVPDAVAPLLGAGLTSCLAVASLPRKRFVARMAPRLGEEEVGGDSERQVAEAKALAGRIHDHASAALLRTEHALMQIHQAVKGAGLTALDGPTTLADRKKMFQDVVDRTTGAPASVTLDSLFSDMDMCECEACLDVTSPTAYLVDLLQYLGSNDLDAPNPGDGAMAGTALAKLFARRPDLQHLQLTCANADTALPMIDLANEVMEAFVVHLGDSSAIETWNVERETTEELLASPSHTRNEAYCILKQAVFPLASLPYFQPLDAARLYLGYLGTSRYELIDTLRLGRRQWPVSSALVATEDGMRRYAALREQLQDRAAAAEYLGINPDDYVIITRQSFWPIGCCEFADDADGGALISVDDYQRHIGVRDPCAYWGYNAAAPLLATDDQRTGLSFVKAQFLPRAGLSYAETAELARTRFVNPMMPSGKDRILLDSIRFSYRFLQRLTAGIDDAARRNLALSAFLVKTQAETQAMLLSQVPPTGNDLVKPDVVVATATPAEIHAWVSKWFECLGKLTVLEAGQGPRIPVRGYLVYVPQLDAERLTMRTLSAALDNAAPQSHPPSSLLTPATNDQARDAPTVPDGTRVLGYLDETGQVANDANELVGFVWMTGQLWLAASQRPIRAVYPSGNLVLVQMARQTVTPSLDVLTRKRPAPDETLVVVDQESYLTMRRSERPATRVKWTVPRETCSIEETLLMHLNGKPLEMWEWDRINRFVRLYKKLQPLGWTITQLDSALTGLGRVPEIRPTPAPQPRPDPGQPSDAAGESGFSLKDLKDKGCGGGHDAGISPCDPSNYTDITPGFLNELMSVQKLASLTSVEFEKLLCLWSDIGTFGKKSLYARLFLTHDVESIDDVFVGDDNGNYLAAEPKIGDHVPVLMAALRLKPDVFDAVVAGVGLAKDSIITIGNLTKLYRHGLLAGMLGIRPRELLDALHLFGDGYASASATLELYLLMQRMADAGFTVKQLRYVVLGEDDALRPLAPDSVKALRTAKSLTDGLLAIDAAQPDLTEQEEGVLSAAQVKAKAALIFDGDVVDAVLGLLEGTRVYTTDAPSGLVVDAAEVPAKLSYKEAGGRATVSATGSLSDAETTAATAMFPGNESWAAALRRLKKQARQLVRDTLGAVVGDAGMEEAVGVLCRGNVAPATDPATPGTAPGKRVFLLRKLMPYLRGYLYEQLIVTTMAAVTSAAPDICAWLLGDVIRVGTPPRRAMEVLADLKKHATTASDAASWTGILVPPTTDEYAFYGLGDTRPDGLVIDGASVPFGTPDEDPSNVWWTAPVRLAGGRAVELRVTGLGMPDGIGWKTARSGAAPVPPGSLVPGAAVGDAAAVLGR